MVEYDGLLYAFYNGAGIIATTSADGIYWPDKGNTEVLVKAPWQSAHQLAPLEFKGKLYLGFIDKTDQGIYLGSTDNRIQPSLPNIQHNTIVVDPQNKNTLYAGNDAGIYYSTDAGQSWMPYSNGLPGVTVNHLKIFPEPGPNGQGQKTDDSRRFLRAATYGRGMFERSLNKDFNNSGPLLYIRKNEMDRGFYDVPPGAGINDSPDIKISYPNGAGRYPFEGPGAVSFYDFSILPDGLAFNRQAINSPALTSDATDTVLTDGIIQRRYSKQASLPEVFRVYAQIHNNSRKWPKDVKVYVLASKDATLPDLPSNFMTTLRSLAPNNKVGSNWILLGTQSLSPPANWEPGVPMVATIELSKSNIPKDSGSKVQLLVLVDSGDAPLNSTPTQVDALVRGSRGAALKSFQIQTTSLGAWKLISGVEAGDVAANSKGDIYVTSKSAVAGGYSIFRYDDNSAKWNPIPGGLTRLALSDDGTLWGVDDAGSVLKREFANQAWAWKTVADKVMAQDIGVGPNGEVWIIGKERLEPYPDHWVCQVLKDGTLKKEEAAISLRIAVDPLGMPWSVNSGGGLFQKVNEEWKFWSGTDGNVMDVGVNQGGAWVTDKYDKIYYFTGMPGNYWKAIDGRAQQISVGKNGLPVVVNSAGEVYVRQ
ncbi:MAG: hypothetical protein H6573_20395 [Lewinellaceae bacterium]|nr:hypothetical protein [Lewinellaceae bacterium]